MIYEVFVAEAVGLTVCKFLPHRLGPHTTSIWQEIGVVMGAEAFFTYVSPRNFSWLTIP